MILPVGRASSTEILSRVVESCVLGTSDKYRFAQADRPKVATGKKSLSLLVNYGCCIPLGHQDQVQKLQQSDS